MELNETAAYLKGLAEGLDLDTSKPEGKLIDKLLALVSDMADSIVALESECADLREYVEELDDDLASVEDDVYGDADDEDSEEDEDDEDDEDEDGDFYEVVCPNCGETVCFDDSIDPENIRCPACGEKFDCTCDGNCDSCDGCDDAE